jgi:PKD repeat protein
MAFPDGWTKYKIGTVPATSQLETDINAEITVTYDSDMKSDFSDIRFVDSDGVTLLSQCRQSYTSGVTSLWIVKIPSKPAAGKTIYCVYGNPSATLLSEPDDTYLFYDDFSGDLSKWDIAGETRIEDEKLVLETSGISYGSKYSRAWSKTSEFLLDDSDGFEAYFEFQFTDYEVYSLWEFGIGVNGSTSPTESRVVPSALYGDKYYYDGSSYVSVSPSISDASLHTVLFNRPAGGQLTTTIDGNVYGPHSVTFDSNEGFSFTVGSASQPTRTGECVIDNIRIITLPSGGEGKLTVSLGDELEFTVADFIADTFSIKVYNSITFTDLSTGSPISWSWTFGDGGVSDEQNPTHEYTEAGNYTVSLTVSDGLSEDTETKIAYIEVIGSGVGDAHIRITVEPQEDIQSADSDSNYVTASEVDVHFMGYAVLSDFNFNINGDSNGYSNKIPYYKEAAIATAGTIGSGSKGLIFIYNTGCEYVNSTSLGVKNTNLVKIASGGTLSVLPSKSGLFLIDPNSSINFGSLDFETVDLEGNVISSGNGNAIKFLAV